MAWEQITLYSSREYGRFMARVRELGFKMDCAYPRFERFVREKPFGFVEIVTVQPSEEWIVFAEGEGDQKDLFEEGM
jgi:hypothetical protein